MVYGAEAVLPCDIIHDSPRVRMYEEREAELDRQDSLDALEEERDVAKSRSAFYQQQARRYQSREVRAKTYNVGEVVLRLPDKKKDNLSPNGKVPSSSTKSLPAVHTVYATHLTTDSSQTHGTQPVSEDFTPSVGLRVRLLPPSTFHFSFRCLCFPSFFLPLSIQTS